MKSLLFPTAARFVAVFASLLLVLNSVANAQINSAQNDIYFVENVQASATSKSSTQSRNLAISTARKDAFLILLTRLTLDLKVADKVTAEEIGDMVRSEQITNEKIAGGNYSASLNILFAKDFVDHILGKKNIDRHSENVGKGFAENARAEAALLNAPPAEQKLIIAGQILGRQLVLVGPENKWGEALGKKLLEKSASKFVAAKEEFLSDAYLNVQSIEKTSYANVRPVLANHNLDSGYVVLFGYDDLQNKAVVDVQYLTKTQKKVIKLSFVNVDMLRYESLLSKVADKVVDYLNNLEDKRVVKATSNFFKIEIPITSLGNWLTIKNKIEDARIVTQMNIESISRDRVLVSVQYINDDVDITDAFAKNDMFLEAQSDEGSLFTLSLRPYQPVQESQVPQQGYQAPQAAAYPYPGAQPQSTSSAIRQ